MTTIYFRSTAQTAHAKTILDALIEGKEIQQKDSRGEWYAPSQITPVELFSGPNDLRVKPEPKKLYVILHDNGGTWRACYSTLESAKKDSQLTYPGWRIREFTENV